MAMQKRGRIPGARNLFQVHFEWLALAAALTLAATLDPYSGTGSTWCLLEWIGTPWCPGEGLGHAIAYMVRGDIYNSLSSNVMGLPAIIIIVSRTAFLLRNRATGRGY